MNLKLLRIINILNECIDTHLEQNDIEAAECMLNDYGVDVNYVHHQLSYIVNYFHAYNDRELDVFLQGLLLYFIEG